MAGRQGNHAQRGATEVHVHEPVHQAARQAEDLVSAPLACCKPCKYVQRNCVNMYKEKKRQAECRRSVCALTSTGQAPGARRWRGAGRRRTRQRCSCRGPARLGRPATRAWRGPGSPTPAAQPLLGLGPPGRRAPQPHCACACMQGRAARQHDTRRLIHCSTAAPHAQPHCAISGAAVDALLRSN
jgi:hypothetical protein